MYKVFHTLIPRGGINSTAEEATAFMNDWNVFTLALSELAENSDGFRFYTRTHRTEAANRLFNPDLYTFEAVDIVAFDTIENAKAFKYAACKLDADFLDKSSSWFVLKENIFVNGSPKGPLDTGPGIRVIASMRRKPGMQLPEFHKHWQLHAELVSETQGISRYITNYIVDDKTENDDYPIDGFVEIWFRTRGDQLACFTDPLMAGVLQKHNYVFTDMNTFYSIICNNAEQWVSGTRAVKKGYTSGLYI